MTRPMFHRAGGLLATAALLAGLMAVAAPGVASGPPSESPDATLMGVLPGESWIVYQTDVGSGNAIWLMRPDATDAHPLVPEVTGEQKHPDWSPDGQRVVFIVSDDIWTAGADGTGAALLWDCGACDYPAWSPDGTRIAFTEYTSGSLPGPASSSIKVLDLATNEVTTVVEEQRPLLVDVARWSPDGTQLVMGVDQMDDAASETGAAVAVAPASGRSARLPHGLRVVRVLPRLELGH